MTKLTGYYNEYGYQIIYDGKPDCILYRAGNHILDSQQDGTGTKYQLSLDTIRNYCEQTGQAMADDKNIEYTGTEHIDK